MLQSLVLCRGITNCPMRIKLSARRNWRWLLWPVPNPGFRPHGQIPHLLGRLDEPCEKHRVCVVYLREPRLGGVVVLVKRLNVAWVWCGMMPRVGSGKHMRFCKDCRAVKRRYWQAVRAQGR